MISKRRFRTLSLAALLAAPLVLVFPADAEGQRGRGRGGGGGGGGGGAETSAPAGPTLSVEIQAQIRSFYSNRGATGAEALPPGIRRNLARGKPLPPGIAKKTAPPELTSRLPIPEGFEILEVGLDVFLVEVATSMVHDVLMDIVR